MEPTKQNFFSQKNNLLIVLGLVFVLIIASYYVFLYKGPVNGKDFLNSVQKSRSLCYDGRCDESVSELTKLVAGASNDREEAEAKTNLALSYLSVDLAKGIETFKEIAANEDYSSARRAAAVEQIADIFMLGGQYREGTLPRLIFSGDPYASFISGDPNKGNVSVGINKLYEYSTKISSRPVSEYRIAEWYASQAYYGKFDPQHLAEKISVKDFKDKALDSIQKGDAARALLVIGSLDEAYVQWVRGNAYSLLSDLDIDKSFKKDAADSFANSLKILQEYSGPSGDYHKSQLLWMSFYYAAFMAKNTDYMNRVTMDELMGYLNNTDYLSTINPKTAGEPSFRFGLMRYLERAGQIKTTSSRGVDYKLALLVAKQESRFSNLLKTLGWEL